MCFWTAVTFCVFACVFELSVGQTQRFWFHNEQNSERHHYFVSSNFDRSNWETSEAKCNETGGHLVAITTDVEQRLLNDNLENLIGTEFWIGLVNLGVNVREWSNGERFSFINFDGDASEQFSTTYRFVLTGSLFRWDDKFMSLSYRYICEVVDECSSSTSACPTCNGYGPFWFG